MPDWETIKRVTKKWFWALFLLATILQLAGLFAGPCNADAPLRRVTAGLYFSCFLWTLGFMTQAPILGSDHGVLWFLTPLTPRMFLQRAVRDMRIVLFMLFVGVPVSVVGILSGSREWLPDGLDVQPGFLVAGLLFYAVCLVVPLCERATGERNVTAPVFLFRHVFVRFWFVVIPVVIALQVGASYCRPVNEHLVAAVDALVRLGPASHVAVFAVSPMSGIALASASPDTAWLLVLFDVFFVVVLVWAVRGVHRAFRPLPSDQVASAPVARWLEEQWGQGDTPDLDDEAEDVEECPELPYSPTLPPEQQLLRHSVHWRAHHAPANPRPRHRAIAWVGNHFWLTVVCVLWCVGLALPERETAQVAVGVSAMFLPLVAAWRRVSDFRQSTTMALTMPLRWTTLLKAVYWHTVAQTALADFLYALLLGTLCLSFWNVPVVAGLFALFLALRLAGFMCQWLEAVRRAGLWWLSWANVGLFIVLFVAGIFCLAALDPWTISGASDASLAAAVTLFVLGLILVEVLAAAILTGVVFVRHGVSVPGHVALLKEDLQ